MKFALVSNILPPSETAHAAIIHRLLQDVDPADYCLLSSRDYIRDDLPNYSSRLPGKYYYLPPPFQLTRGYRFGLKRVRENFNLMTGITERAREITRVLRREQCEAVVVCTGGNEVFDFPSSYLASRRVGARFYAYLLDQYLDMVFYLLGRRALARLERRVIKGANSVIVPNEFLADTIRRRYEIEPVIIHNACDLSAYTNSYLPTGSESGSEIKIIYTGSVADLHYAAFRNLLTALNSPIFQNVRLHLYPVQPRRVIERNGITGPVVYHEYEPVSAMPRIQQEADVLFLPLSFGPKFSSIVTTAAPGKMGEYLASRRPVLVHAPPDSFIAWYFRQHDCGLVVDRDDPAELARALEMLLSDKALVERLTKNAWERAVVDFSVTRARVQFAEVLSQGQGT